MKRCLFSKILRAPKLKSTSFWLYFICIFAVPAFGDSVSIPSQNATLKAAQTPTPETFFSNFDLMIVDRFWFAPQTKDNYLSNEALLTYNFTNRLSFGFLIDYDQPTAAESAQNSDFQDTDLRFTYRYAPSEKKMINWDVGGALLGSLPSSKSSQSQGEYAGIGIKTFFDVMSKSVNLSVSSRYYEYYYQQAYIVSNAVGVEKSEPDNDANLPTDASPKDTLKYTANCNSYSDSSVVLVFNLFPSLMLRNELRYEAYGYFDDHYISLFHDKYGLGYNFAPEFTLWVSEDAVKNVDLPGAIFDSKYTTTIVSLYWRI